MKISEFKTNLLSVLATYLRTDLFNLNQPTIVPKPINGVPYPPNTAYLSEIYDYSVTCTDLVNWVAEFSLDVKVAYRFPNQIAYEQIPITQAENLVSTIGVILMQSWGKIGEDVLSLAIPPSKTPVMVTRMDDSRDWLLLLTFPFSVRLLLDLGGYPALQPANFDFNPPIATLNGLDYYLWRSNVDNAGNQNESVISAEFHLP